MPKPTEPTMHANLKYARIRDRKVQRDFDLYLDGDVIAEFMTIDKVFTQVSFRKDVPDATKEAITPELLEALALA